MKLKTFLLLTTLLFIFSQKNIAAIDIQNRENIEMENIEKQNIFSHPNFFKKNKEVKKKRKFRLRNLLHWKKNKTQLKDDRKLEVSSIMASMFTGLAFMLFLFTNYGGMIPLLLFFGGIFGIIGLTRIKLKPEKRKGATLAWIGIVGMILLFLGFSLFLFFDNFDGF